MTPKNKKVVSKRRKSQNNSKPLTHKDQKIKEALKLLTDNTQELDRLVRVIKIAMTIMRSDGRNTLTFKDIQKSIKYM